MCEIWKFPMKWLSDIWNSIYTEENLVNIADFFVGTYLKSSF